MEGYGIYSLYLKPDYDKRVYEENKYLKITHTTTPLFFEQTDYEIVISSTNGKSISFLNENHFIQDSVGIVRDDDDTLLSGVINFGNMVGYTDFIILSDSQMALCWQIFFAGPLVRNVFGLIMRTLGKGKEKETAVA